MQKKQWTAIIVFLVLIVIFGVGLLSKKTYSPKTDGTEAIEEEVLSTEQGELIKKEEIEEESILSLTDNIEPLNEEETVLLDNTYDQQFQIGTSAYIGVINNADGTYNIELYGSGTFDKNSFWNVVSLIGTSKITEFYCKNSINAPSDVSNMFNFPNLKRCDISKVNFSNTTNFKNFVGGDYLEYLNISGLDISSTDSLEQAFYALGSRTTNGCEIVGLGDLDLSGITNLYKTFMQSYISNISDIKNWDVSSIETMEMLFYQCSNLEDFSYLKDWNTPSLKSISGTFWQTGISDTDFINSWNLLNVEEADYLFAMNNNLIDAELPELNMPKCETINSMFINCLYLEKVNAKNWTTSSLEDMGSFLQGCQRLLEVHVENWDVSKVTKLSGAFYFNKYYNDSSHWSVNMLDLSNWHLDSLTENNITLCGFQNVSTIKTPSSIKDGIKLNVTGDSSETYWKDESLTMIKEISNNNGTGITLYAEKRVVAGSDSYITLTHPNNPSYNDEMGKTDDYVVGHLYGNGTTLDYQTYNLYGFYPVSKYYPLSSNGGYLEYMHVNYRTNLKELYIENEVKAYNDGLSMFSRFGTNIIKLDVSKLDVSDVTRAISMFNGMKYLEELDLSTWNLNSLYCAPNYAQSETSGMLGGCTSLETIYTPNFMNEGVEIALPDTYYNATNILDRTPYTVITSDIMGGIKLTKTQPVVYPIGPNAYLVPDDTNGRDKLIGSMIGAENVDMTMWNNTMTILDKADFVEIDCVDPLDAPNDASEMFKNFTNLELLDIKNLDMTEVTKAEDIFVGCDNLTTIVTPSNTSKIQTLLPDTFYDSVDTSDLENYEKLNLIENSTTIKAAKTFTVNSVGYEGFYNGKAHKITVTPSIEDTIISYKTKSGTYSTTHPSYTEVGEYTQAYKVEKHGYKTVYGSEVVLIKETPNDSETVVPPITPSSPNENNNENTNINNDEEKNDVVDNLEKPSASETPIEEANNSTDNTNIVTTSDQNIIRYVQMLVLGCLITLYGYKRLSVKRKNK